MKQILSYLIAFIIASNSIAFAGDCRKTGTVCADTTPVKQISGMNVTLEQVGGCWKWQDTYECLKPEAINYCSALDKTNGCYKTGSSCIQKAFNGSCMVEQSTYRCGDPSTPAPPNTIKLDNTYTTVIGTDTSACTANQTNPNCALAEHKCVEGPETRIIDGKPVYQECWKWQDSYSCLSSTRTNNCEDIDANKCTQLSSKCLSYLNDGTCGTSEKVFSCKTASSVSKEVLDCGAKTYCIGGNAAECYDAGSEADKDFGKTIAVMEAARQAGVYGTGSFGIFGGVHEECATRLFGAKNCCKTSGGGQSNNSVIATFAGSAAKTGSKYMFDYMYQNSEWLQNGTQAVMDFFGSNQCMNLASGGVTFSMYGFGATTGALSSAGLVEGSAIALGQSGGVTFFFDPYSFALAIAVMVIMSMMECEKEDQTTSMHKGAGLCHYVGSYCSSKFLGACVTTKQSHCCYNSKLARIVNEQGRPQIGKDWGDAKAPNCQGFTQAEFEKLDFAKMDLSEFIADIMASITLPDVSNVSKQIETKVNSYYQNSTKKTTSTP